MFFLCFLFVLFFSCSLNSQVNNEIDVNGISLIDLNEISVPVDGSGLHSKRERERRACV